MAIDRDKQQYCDFAELDLGGYCVYSEGHVNYEFLCGNREETDEFECPYVSRNHRKKRCDKCGKRRADVTFISDPYSREIFHEAVFRRLCEKCYAGLCDDI